MEPQKVLNADLLDIIFEGRNKQYGAYFLRRTYQKNVRKALIIGALGVMFFMSAPLLYSKIMSSINPPRPKMNSTEVKLEDIELPKDNLPPPPPPPPKEIPPPPQATVKYVPPVVKPDAEVKKEEPPVPPDPTKNAGVKDEKGTGEEKVPEKAPEVPVAAPPVEAPKEDNEVYQVVEQQAEFPGGVTELMKYLNGNIKYPAIARENGIQGRVVLKFVVEKDGTVNGITVLKGIHELLDKEAIRVVKSMPGWKAGKQGGRNVRSYFTLPVSFKLEG